MKPNTRFIKSVIETARKDETVMPWTRGTRRAEMIARRAASSENHRAVREA